MLPKVSRLSRQDLEPSNLEESKTFRRNLRKIDHEKLTADFDMIN